MGKKVMFYGNGFGPITNTFNKKLVQYIINKVDVITVRDIQSKEEMRSLGIKKEITVTADVTFAYKDVPDREVVEEKQSKKKIGISVRDWKDEERYKAVIASAGDYLIQKGYEVVFVPMQHPRDYIVSEEIVSIMEGNPDILENKYTIKELTHIMSGFHMMIGMRLHSLIFGAIVGIPVLGIEYDAKIYNFLQIVGQENGGKLEELEEESLIQAIDQVLDHYEVYAERIHIGRQMLQKKSEENIFILKSFMEKGGIL